MTSRGQGRMAFDFLLHHHSSPPGTPVTEPCSETSELPIHPRTNPHPVINFPNHPSIGIMELAHAAELASAADRLHHIPFSPVSTNSQSESVDDHVERLQSQNQSQQQLSHPSYTQPRPKTNTVTTAQPQSSRHSVCPHCNETFNQKIRFLYHLFTVHNLTTYETRTILPCSKCESAFLRNTDRSKHHACVHERLRPFGCNAPNCTSSFFFAKDLSKHRSTVHLRYKPFPCSICNKPFGKREHMTSHVKRVHQKLRPFKCDVCGIRLASKYNLQGHLKTAAHAAAQTLADRDAAANGIVAVGARPC